MDEGVLTMNDKHHYLWRAVDQDRYMLDILLEPRCNRNAAKHFFHKLLKGAVSCPAGHRD